MRPVEILLILVRTMQQLVYDKFGIIPQPECQLVGFKEWPGPHPSNPSFVKTSRHGKSNEYNYDK